jgi:Leucine-rich repeat (LRR) protein
MKTMHLSRQSNTLDLSARNLTTLPREVLKLTGLTALSVARNQIASLPDEMMEFLCNLRFLDLEQNKWVSSPLPLPSKIPRILIPAGASLRGLPRCDCFLGADATLCCDPG